MNEAADIEALYQSAAEAHRAPRYDDAERLYKKTLAKAERIDRLHPRIRDCLRGLAYIYRDEGSRDEEQEQVSRRLLALQEETLGPNDPALITTLLLLGSACWNLDNDNEAEACYRRAIAIMNQATGLDESFMVYALGKLALFLERHERFDEAIPVRERIVTLAQQRLSRRPLPGISMPENSLIDLAQDYVRAGAFAEAESIYRRLVPEDDASLLFRLSAIRGAIAGLAELLRKQDRYGEAETLYRRAVAWCEHELAHPRPLHPTAPASSQIGVAHSRNRSLAQYLRGLAGVLQDSGHYEDAATVAERATAAEATAAALLDQFLRMLREERLQRQAQERH